MLNTLTIALTFHEFFRHSDKVGLAVETGGMGMTVSDSHGDAVGLRTDGLVFKLLHDHFAGALPVSVDGKSPQKPIKGVAGIDTSTTPSGSATYPLDVFAALSADQKVMAVSVISPTERAQECALTLNSVRATGPVKSWQVTAPAGATAPAAPGPGATVGNPAIAAEKQLNDLSATITVPAAGITVLEFAVR